MKKSLDFLAIFANRTMILIGVWAKTGVMQNQEPFTDEQWAKLHSAGAIIHHQSPFSHLPTPFNETPLSHKMTEKWVIPFYMTPINAQNIGFVAACREASPDIVSDLMGEFNWRPRRVGALLVAVRQFYDFQPVISNLLLKSELCCVGGTYCVALAAFGNPAAAATLCDYLDYYLRQPDLWFDQGSAMAALFALDAKLGSQKANSFLALWQKFAEDKPNWKLDKPNAGYDKTLNEIEKVREAMEV